MEEMKIRPEDSGTGVPARADNGGTDNPVRADSSSTGVPARADGGTDNPVRAEDTDAQTTNGALEEQAHLSGDAQATAEATARLSGDAQATAEEQAHLSGDAQATAEATAHLSGDAQATADATTHLSGDAQATIQPLPAPPMDWKRFGAPVFVLMFLTIGLVLAIQFMPRPQPLKEGKTLDKIPATLGDWTLLEEYPMSESARNELKPDEYVARIYVNSNGDQADLSIIAGSHTGAFHNPQVCFRVQNWNFGETDEILPRFPVRRSLSLPALCAWSLQKGRIARRWESTSTPRRWGIALTLPQRVSFCCWRA